MCHDTEILYSKYLVFVSYQSKIIILDGAVSDVSGEGTLFPSSGCEDKLHCIDYSIS